MDWSAGDYSYTFHVILPDNLPTSFDGKYGQIHYEIITTIDRPARYPKVFKLPFTVIQPLDLNLDTIYRVSGLTKVVWITLALVINLIVLIIIYL